MPADAGGSRWPVGHAGRRQLLASYARRARRLGVEPAHLGGYPGRLGALQARLSAAVTTLAEVAQRAIDGELTRPETQLMTQLGAGS